MHAWPPPLYVVRPNQCNGAFHAYYHYLMVHRSSRATRPISYWHACVTGRCRPLGLSGRLALARRPLPAARSTAKKVVPWILVRFWLPLVSEQEGIKGGSYTTICVWPVLAYISTSSQNYTLWWSCSMQFRSIQTTDVFRFNWGRI